MGFQAPSQIDRTNSQIPAKLNSKLARESRLHPSHLFYPPFISSSLPPPSSHSHSPSHPRTFLFLIPHPSSLTLFLHLPLFPSRSPPDLSFINFSSPVRIFQSWCFGPACTSTRFPHNSTTLPQQYNLTPLLPHKPRFILSKSHLILVNLIHNGIR